MTDRRGSKPTARSRPAPPRATREVSSARREEIASAKRRASAAKVGVATVGAIVFAAAAVLARHTFAGHPKAPATALGASPKFLSIVRKNLLAAGVVAPAQAPPGAATAAS